MKPNIELHKPIEQCIAIAEACGYNRYPAPAEHCYTGEHVWAKTNEYPYLNAIDLPNYCRDLNAMHLACRQQSEAFQEEFNALLLKSHPLPTKATSTQWAEIFLDVALRRGII